MATEVTENTEPSSFYSVHSVTSVADHLNFYQLIDVFIYHINGQIHGLQMSAIGQDVYADHILATQHCGGQKDPAVFTQSIYQSLIKVWLAEKTDAA